MEFAIETPPKADNSYRINRQEFFMPPERISIPPFNAERRLDKTVPPVVSDSARPGKSPRISINKPINIKEMKR